MNVTRGDIVYVDLTGAIAQETQNPLGGGPRPCLVIQNDRGNQAATHTIIAPLTDRAKTLPVQVAITPGDMEGFGKACIIQCEQIRTVDASRCGQPVAKLSAERLAEVDAALKISLAL